MHSYSTGHIKPEPHPTDPAPVPEYWASPNSAARQAKVDLATVERLIAAGKVEVERVRGERRVRVDDLLRAVAEGGGD